MKKLLLFLLVLTLLLGACTSTREFEEKTESEIQAEIENEEKPTELTVYAVGDSVFLRKLGGTEAFKYYITSYTIGPFGPLTNAIREYGHMLYGPLERYEQEAGINLNVQFFQNMETMETQIVKDKKEGKRPDVVIGDYSGWSMATKYNNIYRLIYNGWFMDMMPYLEQDQVYVSDEYYNEVLEAGVLGGRQYALPLSFNMNAIFSSKEDMEEIGVAIEEGMDSAQLLEQLTQACVLAEEGELVVDNLSSWSVPTTLIQDYWESTGCSVVNYENGEVAVDRQLFEDIALCFKEYLRMNIIEDWDTVLDEGKSILNSSLWDAYGTPGDFETLDQNILGGDLMKEMALERMNQGVFFYENSTITSQVHSLPGQCVAMDSLYKDLQEERVMVSVPRYKEKDQYMAQVQMYGCISAETKYPYHCYQLLKYLLDQEYDPYYVIPVKKVNTQAMLDKLSDTTYTLHLWLGAGWDYDVDFSKNLETYTLQPLGEDLRHQLQHMLNNIGGASLPEASVYVPLVWHMEAYAFELETMDEAYENACADLEKHMKYIMAGDSEMDFSFNGYTRSFLK